MGHFALMNIITNLNVNQKFVCIHPLIVLHNLLINSTTSGDKKYSNNTNNPLTVRYASL